MSKYENKPQTDEHRYYDGVFSYVDENGESRISAPAHTHKVVNYKQAEAWQAIQETEKWRQEGQDNFTFSVMDALHEVTSVLTNAQCGFMLVLQSYMNYEGKLTTGRKAMKSADMMRVLGLNEKRQTFYDFLRITIENAIIVKKDDHYYVNPRYHFRGSMNGRITIKSYTDNVRKAYSDNKPEDLGLIYRMLPFVNLQTNTICHNPYETTPENVRPLRAKELAEVIGVAPSTLSRRVSDWTFDNEYVLAKVKVGKKTSYMFNPWILYRGSVVPDDTARAIFAVKPIPKN